MRLDVIGPVFSRVFNPQNALADRMNHVVEPSFSISRRTQIASQDRIPSTTGYDRIVGGVTQMTYGLTNRLMVRKDTPGEPQAGAPREMLNLQIRQSYYTDANASQFDTSYAYGLGSRKPKPFSPVSLTARATPVVPLAIDYRVEYDPTAETDSPRLLGMSLNGTLRTAVADVQAGWNRQAFTQRTQTGAVIEANNYISTAADMQFANRRFGGHVSFNYDVAQSTLLNQRYVAFYNAQCCGVNFEYQAFNYPNNPNAFLLPRDRRFNMSFTLAGVGSFSNFFGAFGGSTGLR
jgi:hypothetical protein